MKVPFVIAGWWVVFMYFGCSCSLLLDRYLNPGFEIIIFTSHRFCGSEKYCNTPEMSHAVDLSLATRASNPDAVPGLVEDINRLQRNLKDGDEEARHELAIKARSLLQSVLTPREQMLQHTWADVCDPTSCRLHPKLPRTPN